MKNNKFPLSFSPQRIFLSFSYNDECESYYYYNTKTKIRQWEHPLDAEYKYLVERARKSSNFSTTGQVLNDLSEDASQIDSGIKSLQGDDSDLITDVSPTSTITGGAIRKMDTSLSNTGRFLAPLEKRISSGGLMPLAPIDSTRHKRFEITNYPTNNPLPTPQIGLSMKTSSENRLEPLAKNLENASSTSTFKGFTLSGKGSMFLKSNIKKSETIEPPKPEASGSKILPSNGSGSAGSNRNFKSILRDSSLTDVRTRPDSKTSDNDAEDRKIVRFNLNAPAVKNIGNTYNGLVTSDESSSEDEEVEEEENADWDFEENEGAGMHVKEIKMTMNSKAQQKNDAVNNVSNVIETNDNAANSLTTLFDRNVESSGRIKPLYEDTDSESVPSIKSSNNINRQIIIDEKELRKDSPKPISDRLKLFDSNELMSDSGNSPEIKAADNNFKRNKLSMENRQSTMAQFGKELENDLQQEKENLQKIFAERQSILRSENDVKLKEFEKQLAEETNDKKIELESQHNVEVEKFKQQLKDEFEEKRKVLAKEHRMAEEKLQENHKIIVQELERDLKTEEDLIRKDHASNLMQMKEKMSHELELEKQRMRETGESRLYEKIRCEKRLLEDKYRCLKDKYVRLKSDVKISLERRNQRREQQSMTTGSETSNSNKQSAVMSDMRSSSVSTTSKPNDIGKPPAVTVSHSQRKSREMSRDRSSERSAVNKKFGAAAKYLSHIQQQYHDDTTSISQSDTTISNNYNPSRRPSSKHGASATADNGNSDSEAIQLENNNNVRDGHGRQRKKTFTRMKSASTSRLNSSNVRAGSNDPQLRPCTPVENLRRQLQKLEDLEDQFPDNSLDTTYHLRYPFNIESKDHGGSSSELEFFKHRIHLERDSVRRAKESLRSQRTNFRALKHRHHKAATRHSVDQMIQEEKELTEMEVNLHRTRALLGEKVIRLRHLEQSLQRLYEKDKPILSQFASDKDDATISDLSSHSSSGFSSTDFASDTHHGQVQRKEMYQESTEIIQSLENLNAEIREIWDILSKQQSHGEFQTKYLQTQLFTNFYSFY